jgi:hypothetical protein
MRPTAFHPRFVQYIPDQLDEGVLYIAVEYRTVSHKCCCGCGSEVVTPLDPTQWKLIYDGRVTLHPSVGSWNLRCRSYYWIKENKVQWAPKWTDAQIAAARTSQRHATAACYAENGLTSRQPEPSPVEPAATSLWAKLRKWFLG